MVFLVVALCTLAIVNGQAYHFSQGWLPGGKRTVPVSLMELAPPPPGAAPASSATGGRPGGLSRLLDNYGQTVDEGQTGRRVLFGSTSGRQRTQILHVLENLVEGKLQQMESKFSDGNERELNVNNIDKPGWIYTIGEDQKILRQATTRQK